MLIFNTFAVWTHILERPTHTNLTHDEVYSIQHYVIKFVIDLRQVGGFLRSPLVSSINNTDSHDIAETLLKVTLNTINRDLSNTFAVLMSCQCWTLYLDNWKHLSVTLSFIIHDLCMFQIRKVLLHVAIKTAQ